MCNNNIISNDLRICKKNFLFTSLLKTPLSVPPHYRVFRGLYLIFMSALNASLARTNRCYCRLYCCPFQEQKDTKTNNQYAFAYDVALYVEVCLRDKTTVKRSKKKKRTTTVPLNKKKNNTKSHHEVTDGHFTKRHGTGMVFFFLFLLFNRISRQRVDPQKRPQRLPTVKDGMDGGGILRCFLDTNAVGCVKWSR